MARSKRLDELAAGLLTAVSPRAKSLIMTIFGDSIAPHGGNVWLGSLIQLVEPFGLNERVVRTAVFRLSKDEWLTSRAVGRRSYYGLTESGRRRFEEAHKRIYAPSRPPWEGHWQILIADPAAPANMDREGLKRELLWLGFGQVAPGVFAHPSADLDAVQSRLRELRMADQVVLMQSRTAPFVQGRALKSLVNACWDLDRLDHGYRGFLDHFRPVLRAIEAERSPDPEACFLIRTLLIHDYRRVLLRDPMLPDELLPADWSGAAARQLCGNLYRLTQDGAERQIMTRLETADGPLPPASGSYHARFGGLDQGRAA